MLGDMRLLVRVALFGCLAAAVAPAVAQTAPPIEYRISVPEPVHRWLQVEMILRDVPAAPLGLRMARSSPGRYSVHEFAKNVYDVEVSDLAGQPLAVGRPNPHEWRVERHGGTVRVRYKVFGDSVDGTYLAVDASHAHMNMPATLMWARGWQGARCA